MDQVVTTGPPESSTMSVRLVRKSVPAREVTCSIVVVQMIRSPACTGRVYTKRWSPCTTRLKSRPRPGSSIIACVPDAVRTIGNVGGATTSGWPSLRAASGSKYAGSAAPTASANSRIFSRPTRYGGGGGEVCPAAEGASGMLARGLAGLAVQGVLALARAELLQLKPVRVVAPVLARDVVTLFALRARQRDLGTDVGRLGHGGVPSSLRWDFQRSRIVGAR